MNVIILAAGEGKRLRPLTENNPKCMVKLFDKPILKHQIDIFKSLKINDITVVTGYKREKINFPGINYIFNKNYKTTNMVESLFCAIDKIDSETIISYGDIIFEKRILKKLIKSKFNISVIIDKNWLRTWKLRFDDPLSDAETLKMDHNGKITEIGQKTSNQKDIQGQYIGLMKFKHEGSKRLGEFLTFAKSAKENVLASSLSFSKAYMTDLLQGLIDSGEDVRGVSIRNGWLELDSHSDYKIYKKMQRNGSLVKIFNLNEER